MKPRHRGAGPLVGLVLILWFASLAKGAHDLWAVALVCGGLSLVTMVFLAGSCKDGNSISLPLIFSLSFMLLALLVSSRFSYDMNTTRLELWIWFFSGLAF